MVQSVRPQVEALRQKLLELTLRNRMLNFRPSTRLGVTVTGEDATQVHRILVENGRKMSFTGRPDPPKRPAAESTHRLYDDPVAEEQARQEAIDELNAYLEVPYATVSQSDSKLNTDEPESLLQAKLRTIQREANLASEELGIDTLFLTLGMLEWREPGADRAYRAPLLFVPVVLERQSNGTLRLAHAGGDVGDNLPLRAKLQEYNLQLPVYSDDHDVATYFDMVRSTIRSRGDWALLADEVYLGFFNYEKYVMYVDLGGEAWPDGRKPWEHPELVALLGRGYETPESPVDDRTFLDPIRPVPECHEVYDADSSQTLAMIRAAEGLSIVVEGPPGTGKSQTITNIIAEAVEADKKVLFVSAKRAALEVVKRRLEEAGLGAMCLDLHDKLTNRREFYAELKRTGELSLNVRDEQERVERLTELRERLNAHAAAVNEPLPRFGCTPFHAMARLAALPAETAEDRPGRIDFARLQQWTESEMRKRLPLVEALQTRLQEVGVPREHPFWGAELDYLDPGLQLDLREDLGTAIDACERAREAVGRAAEALRVPAPETFGEVRVLRACVERALSAPGLDGVAVRLRTWSDEEPRVREAISRLRRRREIRSSREAQVAPSAWELDWSPQLDAYERLAERWYRFFSGDFRRARAALTKVLAAGAPSDAPAQRELLRELVEARRLTAALAEADAAMGRLFGVQWRGVESDPELLERLLDWVLRLHAEVEQTVVPEGLLDFFAGRVEDPDLLGKVEAAEQAAARARQAYEVAAGHLRYPAEPEREPIGAALDRLHRWRDGLGQLQAYIQHANVRRQAVEQGLDAVVEVASGWAGAADRLSTGYLRSYYEGVVRTAMAERPALRSFDRTGHEAAVAEFRKLDEFKLAYNRARVRLAHQRRLPSFSAAAGNLLILRQQCELQRRHKPIRWIMARAGEAVMHLKPVFMMSPLSAAVHLPPEAPPFDLVIFDEASQVRPEDALCAILRAKQTIVVGDTRQMPPTSFFDRVVDDGDLDTDDLDEAEQLGVEARKMESILSMMSAVAVGRVRRPDLRWHYRSLHPALIQPSNEMFYDSRLVVFPSASTVTRGRRVGVVFHHLPETVYEAGARKRVNRLEAQRVVEAVLKHLREHPAESLMIAAMNKPQADLIYELLQIREQQEPEPFARFRERHPHEPLDVKNLENVQGDERDVVFVSVTYGRDSAGVIRQQFGPLLRDGGERRLNVLITRARLRCEVFSNLTGDDLRVEAGRPGLAAFQSYLRFAQNGVLSAPVSTGEEPESPFEEEVLAELRSLGYEVEPQVGSEGYRIDLAVRDPEAPGRYLLGIECDGATYHSARSARDRDKLRQRVLEARGWRLHRIWSTDWWRDRPGETARLREAIELARAAVAAAAAEEAISPPPAPEPPRVEITEERRTEAADAAAPYQVAPPFVPGTDLRLYARQVVEVEGPIHHELLLQRLRVAAGYARVGRQVRERLEALLEEETELRQRGDAWVAASHSGEVEPRDRSDLPSAERRIEYVPEVELAAALRQVIRNAYGIEASECARRTLHLLGFRVANEKASSRVEEVLETLLQAGELVIRNGALWADGR
ncbi:MAG: DUF3320 domain-containing protein [Armatimonadota bacterium]